jgi:hypothetical protein
VALPTKPGQTVDPLDKLIKKELGEGASQLMNNSKNFVLATHSANQKTAYAIIRIRDRKIVERGNVFNGYIKWVGDLEIEYYSTPGMVRRNENASDYKRKINLIDYIQERQP